MLTDGRLYFGTRGEAFKAFDVRDGLGIRQLQDSGIAVAIITGRSSPIVSARARDLGITHVLQGQRDKHASLLGLLRATGLTAQECAYMGDDWPDLGILQAVGLAATVADAPDEVKQQVHWVAAAPGGRGAVRELCRLVLQAQGRLDGLLQAALASAPAPAPIRVAAPRVRTKPAKSTTGGRRG